MPSLSCPTCEKSIRYSEEKHAGKRLSCPGCHGEILIPSQDHSAPETSIETSHPASAEIVTRSRANRSEPATATAPPDETARSLEVPWSLELAVRNLLNLFRRGAIIICALAVFGSLYDETFYYREDRFQKDNAVGATANSLERIERSIERSQSIEKAMIAAILIVALRRR